MEHEWQGSSTGRGNTVRGKISLSFLGYEIEDVSYDLKPVKGNFIIEHQHNGGWESIRKEKNHTARDAYLHILMKTNYLSWK